MLSILLHLGPFPFSITFRGNHLIIIFHTGERRTFWDFIIEKEVLWFRYPDLKNRSI